MSFWIVANNDRMSTRGRQAAKLLLQRIVEPSLPRRSVAVPMELI